MTSVRNLLPVAVHVKSGGDARVRMGGSVLSLHDVTSGSFQLTGGATRFRIMLNSRTNQGFMLAVGYVDPINAFNCSLICQDLEEVIDDVPEGTAVYFALIDPSTNQPTTGGENDCVSLSLYG